MDELTRISIRRIFLTRRPNVAYMTAADRLGISFLELKAEIAEGTIVAVSTGMGMRVSKEEMMAAAMRTWPQAVIEEALGADAARVMPEAIRLVELRASVPRYQKEMLQWLARRNQTSVDDVLTRELEDVVCAYAEEIASDVAGFEMAMSWPEVCSVRGAGAVILRRRNYGKDSSELTVRIHRRIGVSGVVVREVPFPRFVLWRAFAATRGGEHDRRAGAPEEKIVC